MFLEDKQIDRILKMCNGEVKPTCIEEEFFDWFHQVFKMKAYGVFCDTMPDNKKRLIVVVWDKDGHKYFENPDFLCDGYNREKQNMIAQKFSELCKKNNKNLDYQKSDNFFVCIETIKDEFSNKIMEKSMEEIKAIPDCDISLVNRFFDRIDVFFETDLQLACHKNDGICDKIEKNVKEIIAKNDKLNLAQISFSLYFSSMETLKNVYNGNLMHYYG